MGYAKYHDFDDYNEVYDPVPLVSNGTICTLLNCTIKFSLPNVNDKDYRMIYWINDKDITKEEAIDIFDKVSKLLSCLFMLPMHNDDIRILEVSDTIGTNKLLSKRNSEILVYIENKINKFDKIEKFFYEVLDLMNVAIENLFKLRMEDAFFYFFKVIERISKNYYKLYTERYYRKKEIHNKKEKLRKIVSTYIENELDIMLIENLLRNKTDSIYQQIVNEAYGSVFGKISFFVKKNNISIAMDDVSKIIKTRNKIAHGDFVDEETLATCLGRGEYLAVQMFSKQFFKCEYEQIYIKSRRYEGNGPVYKTKQLKKRNRRE